MRRTASLSNRLLLISRFRVLGLGFRFTTDLQVRSEHKSELFFRMCAQGARSCAHILKSQCPSTFTIH